MSMLAYFEYREAFVFHMIKVLSKVFSFLPLFSLQRVRAIMREHSHADAAASPAL